MTPKTSIVVNNPYEFLIDNILPAREVHLLAGPSGAGKSTYLFQFLDNWTGGGSIFSHKSHPQPYLYVSCDRSLASVHRTIQRVGTVPPSMMLSACDQNINTIDTMLTHALTKYPLAKLIVLDAIASFTPQGKVSDYDTVKSFLHKMTRWCQIHDRTILGTAHSAKTKEGETYLSPRERILGSVAWGGYSDTIIFIEPAKAEETGNSLRYLHLLPRNAKEEKYQMELSDSGLLVQAEKKLPPSAKLRNFLASLSEHGEFTFEEAFIHSGSSKQFVTGFLGDLIDKNEIFRPVRGTYRKRPTPTEDSV